MWCFTIKMNKTLFFNLPLAPSLGYQTLNWPAECLDLELLPELDTWTLLPGSLQTELAVCPPSPQSGWPPLPHTCTAWSHWSPRHPPGWHWVCPCGTWSGRGCPVHSWSQYSTSPPGSHCTTPGFSGLSHTQTSENILHEFDIIK